MRTSHEVLARWCWIERDALRVPAHLADCFVVDRHSPPDHLTIMAYGALPRLGLVAKGQRARGQSRPSVRSIRARAATYRRDCHVFDLNASLRWGDNRDVRPKRLSIPDARGQGASLRVTRHPEQGKIVLSHWRDGLCVASTPIE